MIHKGLIALAIAATLTATAHAKPNMSKTALIKRGGYLVNAVMTCGNCHTPKGPHGDIMAKAFSGGLTFDEPPFKVTAPNITEDKTTGIGKWSNADIERLLRKLLPYQVFQM